MFKQAPHPSNGNSKNLVTLHLLIVPSIESSKEKVWSKKSPYTPTKGVESPLCTKPLGRNNIHQTDLLGPRYIKNDGRFYSLHVMDLYSHRVFLHPQRRALYFELTDMRFMISVLFIQLLKRNSFTRWIKDLTSSRRTMISLSCSHPSPPLWSGAGW